MESILASVARGDILGQAEVMASVPWDAIRVWRGEAKSMAIGRLGATVVVHAATATAEAVGFDYSQMKVCAYGSPERAHEAWDTACGAAAALLTDMGATAPMSEVTAVEVVAEVTVASAERIIV